MFFPKIILVAVAMLTAVTRGSPAISKVSAQLLKRDDPVINKDDFDKNTKKLITAAFKDACHLAAAGSSAVKLFLHWMFNSADIEPGKSGQ